ncbi:LamG-like jellyroll fold domain-containing protein [Candidatus Latescibacterota bacterium]
MKRILNGLILWLLLLPVFMVSGNELSSPVNFHLSFENLDFLKDCIVAQSGYKTIEDRGLVLENAKFGKGLKMNLEPSRITLEDMTGTDLDMVTAVSYNTRHRGKVWVGYNEPFLWGAGKLNPGAGSVAFWVNGPIREGMLFNQSAMAWGRKEKYLLSITVDDSGCPGAYIRDSRYIDHIIQSDKPLKQNKWNHVALNWDKSRGLELFVNGRSVASSWGNDAWWETPLSGLLHLPMPKALYDEFYVFSRPLTKKEISELIKKNEAPTDGLAATDRTPGDRDRLAAALGIADNPDLPVATPMEGSVMLSFHEIVPDFAGDGTVPAWFCRDGRYELAWPHPISVFTLVPGDVDFMAKKLDIDSPPGVPWNYITIEGNLKGMPELLTELRKDGDRFTGNTFVTVPQDGRFFHGAMVERKDHPRITLPFLKGYGAPGEFKGDLHLVLTGETRIHEVSLFDVYKKPFEYTPGEQVYYLRRGGSLEGRYDFAMRALNSLDDRGTATGYMTPPDGESQWLKTGYLSRTNIITPPMNGSRQIESIVLDLRVTTESAEDILLIRLRDPGMPHRIWTHAEVKLSGFDGDGGHLRLELDPPPLFLADGDVVWLDIASLNNAAIAVGGEDTGRIILKPATYHESMQAYEDKALLPVRAEYMKAYHHQPWLFTKSFPDVMNPCSFGGQFDSVMPAQAVLRTLPHSRPASYFVDWAKPKYYWGGFVNAEKNFPIKNIDIPNGVPRWAWLQHLIQNFRYSIIDWIVAHQNEDGQLHGGWNDDTLALRGKGDIPLDSCDRAADFYFKVYEGLDRTGIFAKGFCQIHPIDALHNGDFVRERFRGLLYRLGDPYVYRRSLETAWHWDKPDETPINYSEGKPFLFAKNTLEWFWGKNVPDKPYKSPDWETLDEKLSRLASYIDDTLLFRYTDARIHTDNYRVFNEQYVERMVLGGSANSSISIAWPEGGGKDISRWVTYADDTKLECRMFSFDPLPRAVTARLCRIHPGTYEVVVSEDNNGSAGAVLSRVELALKRFGTVSFEVPSGKPVILTVSRISNGSEPTPLPDLAVAEYDCIRDGESLRVRVSNLGASSSRETTVSLFDESGIRCGTLTLPALDAPTDFVEKSRWLSFIFVSPKKTVRIVVDPDNRINEILEENNVVVMERIEK